MGSRLLRTSILQPSNNLATIESRLDAVQEFVANETLFFSIKDGLKAFPDIDKLISSFIQSPKRQTIKNTEQVIYFVLT